MTCKNCGRENSNESKICMYCGNSLSLGNSKDRSFSKLRTIFKKKNKKADYSYNYYKKNNSLGIFIIIAIIVLAIFGSLLAYQHFFMIERVDFKDLYLTDNFFVADLNEKDKYYLYDNTGKKVLEEAFYSVDKFYNKASIVYNDLKKVGLISEDGRMLMEFGKYLKIERKGFLYKVTDLKNKQYLVDKNNKKIADLEKVKILDTNSNYFLILRESNTYKVLDYKGDKLINLTKIGANTPSISVKSGYLSLFYNGINYLFDLTTSRKILEFKDLNHYCVNSVNDQDKGEIILNLCSKDVSKNEYKYINNGKIVKTITDECSGLSFSHGNLVCKSIDTKKVYMYSRDMYKSFLTTDKTISYYSDQDYIKYENNGISFYKDNRLLTKDSCYELSSTGRVNTNIYRLKTVKNSSCNQTGGMYQFIKTNGKKLDDVLYKYAIDFDKNNNSIVSLDGHNFYLINQNGDKISDEYSYMNFLEGSSAIYYLATNSSGTYILNKTGKEVYTLSKGENASIETVRDNDYLLLQVDNLYKVYDILNEQMVVEGLPSYVLTDEYITTLNYDAYFTYRGALITKK